MKRPKILVIVAIVVGLSTATAGLPAAVADEPHPESLPSFSESPGCGALDGTRGPLVSASGVVPMSEKVYGPWGDFYGRRIDLIYEQLVPVYLPTHSDEEMVHRYVYPAVELALANLAAEAAAGNVYQINRDTYSWWRVTVPPGRYLSFHAAGAVFDINATTNPYSADNVLITDMIDWGAANPYWFVDAWRDAGWCWGGDWQSIKDPMHISWMGPVHTPGYEMPPKQPPLATYSGYQPSVGVGFDVRFDSGPGAGSTHFAVDIERDGATDIVRLRPSTGGRIVLEVARARYDYHWSTDWAETRTAPTDPAAPVDLADVTGDARPDLVYLLEQPNGKLSLEVFPFVQSGQMSPTVITTEISAEEGDVYLFDDFDLDGWGDLFVVRPGTPGSLEIWSGPTFDATVVSVAVDLPAGARYSTGDRNFDWVPDLFVLSEAGVLQIRPGKWHDSGAYEAVNEPPLATLLVPDASERLFVEDLDGDGHPDLMLVGANGELRMRRGGNSSHDPAIWYQLQSHRITRYAGADRYATAVAISQGAFPSPSAVSTVFVATGENYPDALAGSAAAARLGAPLLLVASDSIPPAVAAELARLDPDTVVVLGGPAVVSAAVESDLRAHGEVIRVAGASRYDTAVAVSKYAFSASTDTVYVATGVGYADAIAAAAAAGQAGAPVLLTAPTVLPGAVAAEIERLGPSRIVVVGGTAAVSDGVFNQLKSLAATTRIAGSDRYDTAAKVSLDAFPQGAQSAYVATGLNFPDALAGAAVAGFRGAPILLVPGTMLPSGVAAEILRLGAYDVFLLGGTSVISLSVGGTIETLGM